MIHCKAHQLDGTGFCNRFDSPCIKKNCRFFGVETNADRIRAMSDEELADMLTDFSNNGGWVTETGREICYEQHIDWLKQPAEDSL